MNTYTGFCFAGDKRGETFDAQYIGCDFTEADLTGADLSGAFLSCTFNATWRRAARTGTFTDCREE